MRQKEYQLYRYFYNYCGSLIDEVSRKCKPVNRKLSCKRCGGFSTRVTQQKHKTNHKG
jgi:hypothetical protein